MQQDVLDVQARESVADMLYCVNNAPLTLNETQKAKIALA